MSSTPLPNISPLPSASVLKALPIQIVTLINPPSLLPLTSLPLLFLPPIIPPTAAVVQVVLMPPTPLVVAHEAAHPVEMLQPAGEPVSVAVGPWVAPEGAQLLAVAAAVFLAVVAVVLETSLPH